MNFCKFFHKEIKYEVSGSNLIITVENACEVCDKEPFNFRLCECLPTTITAPLQVFIVVNGANAPLEDKNGNYIYSNQLKLRKTYIGVYGDNPAHVLAFNENGY